MQKKTINISVPQSMAEFIEHEVESGEYASTSDFFRTLVRGYQARRSERGLERLISERQASARASDEALVPQEELEREFLARPAENEPKKLKRSREEELRQGILLAREQMERGEVHDGKTVFRELRDEGA